MAKSFKRESARIRHMRVVRVNTGRGQAELYVPDVHGQWEIVADGAGTLSVRQYGLEDTEGAPLDISASAALCFPLESHLRDFIARNLSAVGPGGVKLTLYHDGQGRNGIEYPTGVGPIDILAVDAQGNFVVFELKLSKGPDSAVGQLLRYMGGSPRRCPRANRFQG
jgi:hypothetical protein